MRQRTLLNLFGVMFLLSPILWAQQASPPGDPPKNNNGNALGKVYLQLNEAEPEPFEVTQAILYERVSIRFDTTLILQNDGEMVVYYYPQLAQGEHYVLRMILHRAQKERPGYFEVFYDLGDTLFSPLVVQDSTARVFFSANGELLPFRPFARNFRGHFELQPGKDARSVSGRFESEFDYPVTREMTHFAHIKLWGTLEVPVGPFREIGLEAATLQQKRKQSFRRNIGVALIFAAIIIFFIGT